jgi:steroid 5-alpha reductase family enzyme
MLLLSPTMSQFTGSHSGIPPTFKYPLKFCLATTATVYVLSLVTGNVSQVDRVWTFLPTIYTAYFALLPLWPRGAVLPLWPYTPIDVPSYMRDEYSPRALLMLSLVVSVLLIVVFNTLLIFLKVLWMFRFVFS